MAINLQSIPLGSKSAKIQIQQEPQGARGIRQRARQLPPGSDGQGLPTRRRKSNWDGLQQRDRDRGCDPLQHQKTHPHFLFSREKEKKEGAQWGAS